MIRRKKTVPAHSMKVRKGDQVVVVSGNDKGKKGKVLKVFPNEDRIIVEGVRQVKRHTKPRPNMPQGGIVEREGKIHVSNVMVICPKTGKASRIGHKLVADDNGKQKRVRVAKVSGEVLG